MATDFAWVIELPGPAYLTVGGKARRPAIFEWTLDHNNALRFCSKQQADDVLMAVRVLRPDLFPSCLPIAAQPVQHGWMETPDDAQG